MVPPVAASQQHQPKMQGRLAYPRPSWLTMAEQKQYLELYDKYMKYIPAKASGAEVKEIYQLKVGLESLSVNVNVKCWFIVHTDV